MLSLNRLAELEGGPEKAGVGGSVPVQFFTPSNSFTSHKADLNEAGVRGTHPRAG